MTTTYRIAPAPKLASQYEWDCALCGHETLARPVFLSGPAGVVFAAGTGCASVALYGRKDAHMMTKVRNAADAAAHVAKMNRRHHAERAAIYAAAIDAFFADDDAAPQLRSARLNYGAVGGYSGTLTAFPMWMLRQQVESEQQS
jgi:hypothetical protein